MTYVPLSSIDIDTITEKSGKLTRKIKFNIPQKTLDQNSGKIRSYFDRNDITWENTSDGKTLCISFNANNFLILHRKQDLFFTLKVPLGPIILHAVRTIHLNLRSITRNLWTYQTFFPKKEVSLSLIHLMVNRFLMTRSRTKKSVLLLPLHNQFLNMRLLLCGIHQKISDARFLFPLEK